MKYDFNLDLDLNTSTGKMIATIADRSKVLEFGPGNGRMTEFLCHEKKCQVDIVEFDSELYKHVMQFAEDGFLGDIESLEWMNTFAEKKYDYIIFADVLEHLRDPENVLAKAASFLKTDGKFLISFPNLAHNSVLIDLFNNKIEWQRYGLLDKTHLSYYTESGFREWFEKIGLYIELQDYTYSKVGENELSATYNELPTVVRYPFENRLFGEVYQYFYILSKNPVESVIKQPENSHFVYEVHCQYQAKGMLYTERVLINNFTGENKRFTLEIPIEAEFLKIFPILSKQDTLLKFQLKANNSLCTQVATNANWMYDDEFAFYKGKQPFFELSQNQVAGKTIEIEIDYLFTGTFPDITRKLFDNIQLQKGIMVEQADKWSDLELKYEQKIELINNRYLESVNTSLWEGLKRQLTRKETTRKELLEKVKFQIEAVDYDEEVNRVFIRGWGFEKENKEPLFYRLAVNEAPFYQVTKQFRPDVNDQFEIDRERKLGFLIEIDFPIPKDKFHLTLQTTEGEEVNIKIDRFNLSRATKMQRLRYLLGSVRQKGIKGTLKHLNDRRMNKDLYDNWIERHEQFDLEAIQLEINKFDLKPLISIVVPVYNVEEKWLQKCVESMENQFYSNWELCLADDCSPSEHVRPLLENYAAKDSRIKVTFRKQNGHISAATNSAIMISKGSYIGFMDNDDELAPNALYEVVKSINENRAIDFIYTDEDKMNIRGKRFDPFFKPEWNEELLRGHNYITHFVVVKRSLVDKVGMLRSEYDGSQDYDFVLRATEKATCIHHIPKILYHWRTVETSVAFDPQSKEYAYIAGQNALEDSFKRRDVEAEVKMKKDYGCYKITYLMKNTPKVSILVYGESPNKLATIQTILEKTLYANFELITSIQDSPLEDPRVKLTSSSNLSEMMNLASGSYFVTIRAGLIPKDTKWLDELINYGQRHDIGIVGGKIINKQDVVLNAGVSYDEEEAKFIYEQRGISDKSLGYYFRISLPRELYAVTEECLFIRRSVYEKVKGIGKELAPGLSGIDLCLQVRFQAGKKIMWEPYTVMVDLDNSDEILSASLSQQLSALWPAEKMRDNYRNLNHLER